MKKIIKISIIMPIYNVEKYLERGISSILNQTFKEFELILINDGSTDDSLIICNNFKSLDSRIKVINKKNEGVSSSRNLGINIAKGEFIMFVDPDDTLEEDALEYLYNLTNTYNSGVSCYKMNTYINGISKTNININEEIKIYKDNEIVESFSCNGVFLYSVCNKLYRKNLLRDIRFNEDIRYAEDALFNFYVLSESKLVVMSNQVKYNYYINESSTVNKFNEKRVDILKAQCEIYNLLKSKYNNYTESITRDYIRSSIHIMADMAKTGKVDKEILLKLRHIINNNSYMLSDKSLLNKKEKMIFNILKVMPINVFFLYKTKFYIKKLIRGRVRKK